MLSPQDAWQATLGQLQLQLNRATFDTWLKGAEVLAYEDGEFVIRVRHAYAKDWLERHLQHMITKTLGGIFGRSVRINFVVYLPNRQRWTPQPGTLWDYARQNEVDESSEPHPTAREAGARHTSKAAEEEEDDEDDSRPDYSRWDPRLTDVRRTPSPDEDSLSHIYLDRRYTFESFVVGPSNDFAFAAAQAVAETPAGAYNPLFIYGDTGLGKTHLLQAIGHACRVNGQQVIYVTAETFTNELVASIRSRNTADFQAQYRRADVLLVDDIRFLAGKKSTEEEFYHTFNTIYNYGGQIVIASDCHPRHMKDLDKRLRTRLESGLSVDILPPELETRLEILRVKSAAQDIDLPEAVAYLLAHHATGSVRELEGVLTQVLARATLTRQPLTIELAKRVLTRNSAPTRRTTNLSDVLEATASYHQLSLDDLMSKQRTKEVVRARHIAIYLAREETDASLPQIGEALGGRKHSTILHGYQKIANEVTSDDTLQREVSAIRRQLRLFPDS
ncbi:MAG: chromosomal replication initiator protein DnaA [Anaerolineae bacterium]|nr:chromosomal replication initiator protein DnaA [Anaerolineae bacterium]